MVAHACNPSYSGGWGRRIAWTPEAEAAVSQDHTIALQPGQQEQNTISKKRIRTSSWSPWLMSVIPALWETEAGRLFELARSSRPVLAKEWELVSIKKIFFFNQKTKMSQNKWSRVWSLHCILVLPPQPQNAVKDIIGTFVEMRSWLWVTEKHCTNVTFPNFDHETMGECPYP